MAAKKKAVTKRQQTAAATTSDINIADIQADSGMGMEGTDKDSYAIPFLSVLQSNSPQLTENDGAYIEEARQGMLFNTVTQQLFSGKDGVDFVPCAFNRRFIRWAPRKQGGGFKGELLPEQVAKLRDCGEIKEHPDNGRLYFPLDDGAIDEDRCDLLADTRSHFGLVLTEDGPQRVLLALTSTQIKKSRMLMSMLDQIKVSTPNGKVTPPTFYNVVHINTVPESNDQGSWYGVKFTPNGFVTDNEVYQNGKAFHNAVVEEKVDVNYEKAGNSPNEGDDEAF